LYRIYLIILLLNIYTIFEGWSQSTNLQLEIEGFSKTQTAIIDSLHYQKKFTEYNALTSVIDSLKEKLYNFGYVDLVELERLHPNDSLYISKLDLGSHYKNLKLLIAPNKNLNTYIKALGTIPKNDTIVLKTAFAKAFLELLSAEASQNGKPFTSFQIQNIQKQNRNTLSGNLKIAEDTTRYINNIIVQDYNEIPRGFLKHYAGFKTGETFNQNTLLKKSDALNNLSFISIKKNPEVLFTNDSTTVYIYASRKSNNRFDGFIGFATDEETNRLRLDGYLDLILTNNLNYGEQLILNYKSDGNDQQQLNVKATLPYLFKSPLGLDLQLALFRKDSTFSETSQQASIFYQLKQRTKIGLGYKNKRSENLQDEALSDNTILDYTQNRISGNFNYTVLSDDILFPKKTFFDLYLEAGNRNTDTTEESQFSIDAHTGHILKLNPSNQIYLSNRTQVLFSDSFLTNELFRFGGIISIRGFDENSIFANLQSTLNTEYRYILSPSLYVHSIIDAGYFENDLLNQRTRLFSFGFGAGLLTKSGVFKINIANGRNEDQEFLFANTRIHLRLEARF